MKHHTFDELNAMTDRERMALAPDKWKDTAFETVCQCKCHDYKCYPEKGIGCNCSPCLICDDKWMVPTAGGDALLAFMGRHFREMHKDKIGEPVLRYE